MNASDCGDLLRACAFYDNRKVTKEAMAGWSQAIKSYVDKADALQAIAEHHANSADYILPVHVNDRVRAIQRERLARAGTPPIPGDLTQAQEREWQLNWASYVRAGADKDHAAALASTDMDLPPELPMRERKAEMEALITAAANRQHAHTTP